MIELSESFGRGDSGFSAMPESAFSGSCYHLNSLYNPTREHHGAFAFVHEQESFLASGIFSFFFPEDPYARMSSRELIERLGLSSPGFTPTYLEEDAVRLDYPGRISYWFRSDQRQEWVITIGREVGDRYINYVFCELRRRP